MSDMRFYEIVQRMRDIESAFIGLKLELGNMAAIVALEAKLAAFFDKLIANYSGKLPFNGYYLKKIKAAAMGRLDSIKGQVDEFFVGGNVDKFADFLGDHLKGHVGGFVGNLVLSWAISWMKDKNNQHFLQDGIGQAGPDVK
jgi:hypothetical protein